jgi:hypothetical protein
MLFSENFLFEEKKSFPNLSKKSISEGIFSELRSLKMPSEFWNFILAHRGQEGVNF